MPSSARPACNTSRLLATLETDQLAMSSASSLACTASTKASKAWPYAARSASAAASAGRLRARSLRLCRPLRKASASLISERRAKACSCWRSLSRSVLNWPSWRRPPKCWPTLYSAAMPMAATARVSSNTRAKPRPSLRAMPRLARKPCLLASIRRPLALRVCKGQAWQRLR
ncbi:hypothetical protein D3C79_647400 [compost metagenome]